MQDKTVKLETYDLSYFLGKIFLLMMLLIKFDKDHSALEQNSYANKTINLYIVYELETLPKIPLKNFTLKNCLLE